MSFSKRKTHEKDKQRKSKISFDKIFNFFRRDSKQIFNRLIYVLEKVKERIPVEVMFQNSKFLFIVNQFSRVSIMLHIVTNKPRDVYADKQLSINMKSFVVCAYHIFLYEGYNECSWIYAFHVPKNQKLHHCMTCGKFKLTGSQYNWQHKWIGLVEF